MADAQQHSGGRDVPHVAPVRASCPCCGGALYRVTCERCGRGFDARSAAARYCSTRCRVAAHREHSS